MKVIYEKEISAIKDWLQRTNAQLSTGALPAFLQTDCWRIQNDLQTISTNIQYEYPFYGHELLEIKNRLFSAPQPPYGMMLLNAAAFGELFIIIKHISSEPIDTRFWQDIHPRIIAVSKGLFCDGHFAAASQAAIKEVETRMRELFKEGKPNSPIPKDAAGLIGALLSDNGFYQFCDTSEISGANFRKGVKFIFEGAFMAYRNPSMHANLTCSQREAFERIVQASQMMGILTSGEVRI